MTWESVLVDNIDITWQAVILSYPAEMTKQTRSSNILTQDYNDARTYNKRIPIIICIQQCLCASICGCVYTEKYVAMRVSYTQIFSCIQDFFYI